MQYLKNKTFYFKNKKNVLKIVQMVYNIYVRYNIYLYLEVRDYEYWS